ncbi:ROK family protein [Nocardia sp. NPDC006630]|uniref:ROK family protein n=1 Tax=Nocardia sp. NPDC006630 TaxID=3157181 RepID=UPI0033BF4166
MIATTNDEPVIVHDIGGTWWRSAIVDANGALTHPVRYPAVTRAGTGRHPSTLRELLVRYLLDRTWTLLARYPGVRRVGISLGAAINATTGQVMASAPLWGDALDPFDLRAVLTAAEPGLIWCVASDVTCLVVAIAAQGEVQAQGWRCLTGVTVSTGIAARTIDVASGVVLVDPIHGIQGEIGHLPALSPPPPGTVAAELICDCGATGHIAAISSGAAIERNLAQLSSILDVTDSPNPPMPLLARLHTALQNESASAAAFLDASTAPVALGLLYLLTIDPRVDHVYVTGGVVDMLGEHWMASLYRTLEHHGLYLASTHQPSIFRERITRLDADGHEPMRGAARLALDSTAPAARQALEAP